MKVTPEVRRVTITALAVVASAVSSGLLPALAAHVAQLVLAVAAGAGVYWTPQSTDPSTGKHAVLPVPAAPNLPGHLPDAVVAEAAHAAADLATQLSKA